MFCMMGAIRTMGWQNVEQGQQKLCIYMITVWLQRDIVYYYIQYK